MVDNNRIEETLSALMDSEAGELETRRVLKEISQDSELRDRWHRYQLASAAMKRDLPHQMVDLSASISAAIEEESLHKPGFGRFAQPLGKVAVAASVALLAVLGVQQFQSNPAAPTQTLSTQVANAPEESGAPQFQLPAGIDLPPVSARTVSAGTQYDVPHSRPTLVVSQRQVDAIKNNEAAIRDYLNSMMERHTRNAANSSSNQGLLPLARLPQTEEK